MIAPRSLYPGAAAQIVFAGQPVIAVYAGALGGRIANPYLASDQGITHAETLFIDLINPAALEDTATTFPLQPGESYALPWNLTSNVSVNAATAGHAFSVVIVQTPTPYPPTPPTPSPFPPVGPTSVLTIPPTYIYQEYADDDDLQAFAGAWNSIAQGYLVWFNTANLPVYTNPAISGALLDWIGQGVYGEVRPALSSGQNTDLGTYNSCLFNQIPFNEREIVGSGDVVATSDDIYKRCLTWNYYKGDGRQFNVRWLKRRIMRFLTGTNGSAPNVDNTWQVSVSFGLGNEINIRLLTQSRVITESTLYNGMLFNDAPYNNWDSAVDFDYPPLPNAAIFAEALQAGVLQTPFQYDFTVTT
ncbi:MAG TPA: hypothetical protein VMV19_17630 [Xanthobacteraceae bacterium]|nr:hypothetical protein [Xanthobacteraceae bacterium]